MLPVTGFPWIGGTLGGGGGGWMSQLFGNIGAVHGTSGIFDLKKEIESSTPSTTSDGTADGTDCVVCGDKSSGKHYGQFSCEGCKSFFKRSIRRSLSYTCRAAKNCAIDVQHRNQCQYCRLKKCIRMGMRKEAVQRGRLPVGLPSFFPHNMFLRSLPFMSSSGGPGASAAVQPPPQPPPPPPPPAFMGIYPSFSQKESVYEFAAQTIFATVNWARASVTNLQRNDRSVLLKHSWTPIFLFALAHSSFGLNLSSQLNEGKEVFDDDEDVEEVENDGDGTSEKDVVVGELQKRIDRIRETRMDIVEVSSVRAIMLFECDEAQHGRIEEKEKVSEIVEKLKSALEEYCKTNKAPTRFADLLDCIQLLRSSRTFPISSLFFAKLVCQTPIESIICDLLNMNIPHPIAPLK